MTREEATKILDPETTLDAYAKISYYGGFEGESAWQKINQHSYTL